jgi:hypothetical protein
MGMMVSIRTRRGEVRLPDLNKGVKFDDNKVRVELFPGEAIFAISSILTFGANKYSPRNWELGMGWGRVFGATMRHLWCWWQGKGPTNKSFVFGEFDEETGWSHLWHAGACIIFLITYEMRGTGHDDRPIVRELAEDS